MGKEKGTDRVKREHVALSTKWRPIPSRVVRERTKGYERGGGVKTWKREGATSGEVGNGG